MTKTFEENFNTILKPALHALGFRQMILKRCICPEFLFYKKKLWFSWSWDWRERYLDVSLGHLFWFKDVMKSVVVIGDYSHYESQITPNAIDTIGSESAALRIVADSLSNAVLQYEEKYDEIFQAFRVSRSQGGGINIDEYIGKEVSMEDLKKFQC